MASSTTQNSPLPPWIWKYDVFLSFRGDDTRLNFVDHLFAALNRRALITFKDDGKLKKGKIISEELFKAIEESQICIVVLSKDYAGSTWCLKELAKIVDCNEQVDRNRTILPVFYDVDPSEVRKQTGSYGEAFARHEETSTNSEVQRWREALSKVGNLSGWDTRNKCESKVIEELVQVTISVLGHKFSNLADEYVEMQSRLEILDMHLALKSNDVRYIGIVGMGGIGKTALARVLYDRICHYFQASSFLADVNKGFEDDGLINLQKQLLCETLHEENIKVRSLHNGTNLICGMLRNIKSLIVLDDVGHSYQLEKLVGKPEWFGARSRIIITTRDEHILTEYGVDHVYKVELLNKGENLQLFCRKAFKHDNPSQYYEKLTYEALEHVKGLPLAIKVLGSFLCGLNVSEWKSALAELRENPKKEIIDVLRRSFDGLETSEKEIFLDIACFFQGCCMWFVKDFLNSCGYHPDIGIIILIDRSLIDIVEGMVRMHDLLQDLGKKIVMEKSSKEPGKWSRLWRYKHLQDIMRRNSATEDIEVLACSGLSPKEMKLNAKTLSKMSHLRILVLDGMKFSGNPVDLSHEIQFFRWTNYPDTHFPHPFTRSPSMFQLDKLIELIMPYSSSKQLWEGIKPFNNIKYLSFSDSKNLIKTPDFRGMPNLKWLCLDGCTSLTHVDESIGVLSKLEVLMLDFCTSLVGLPSSISCLISLQILGLASCSKLKFPYKKTSDADCLKEFMDKSTFTSTIVQKAMMSPFQFFTKRQKQPSELLVHDLQSLQALYLHHCNLRELPDAIGWMNSLKLLALTGNKFVTLPSAINKLSRLEYLSLGQCRELHYLPELPMSIETDFLGGKLPSSHILSIVLPKGLYINNCPKLVENEIQPYTKLAVSWLTKLVQLRFQQNHFLHDMQEIHHTDAEINIVIPGNDVPEWFNHQSLGHSTKVQLPDSSEWIGLALCVALMPTGYDNDDDVDVIYDTDFVVELCGTHKTIRIPKPGHHLFRRALVKVESNHLWLFYLSREETSCRILQTWGAGKEVEFRATGKDLKVMKCGARWVSEKDIQELLLLKKQC